MAASSSDGLSTHKAQNSLRVEHSVVEDRGSGAVPTWVPQTSDAAYRNWPPETKKLGWSEWSTEVPDERSGFFKCMGRQIDTGVGRKSLSVKNL